MNGLDPRIRGWLVWLLPFVVLAGVIAWEADWGRKWRHVPSVDAATVPQPVVVAVLPEYTPAATPAAQHDFVDRTLFNPTRRPAPAAPAEGGKKRLQSGQFVLTGTLIVDGKATAFLRENAGGKSRRVAQGDQINGMLVADVKPDRVMVLKIATGPKTTTQPVAAVPGAPGAPGVGGGTAQGAPTTADVLAERRRAQQAAEAAANRAAARQSVLNAPPAGAFAPPAGAQSATGAVDPRWAESDARVRARANKKDPGAQ